MLENFSDESFQYNGKINDAKKSVAMERNKVKTVETALNQLETQLSHQKGLNTLHTDYLQQLRVLESQIRDEAPADMI